MDKAAGSLGKAIDRVLIALACVAVLYVVAAAVVYGIYPGYVDHGEPIVAAAAFRMLDGALVYPPFDGPDFTSNIYGPFTYLFNGLVMAMFGGTSLTGKLAGLLALLGAVLAVWATYRHHGPRTLALALLMIAGFLVLLVPYSIWNRPDPFLVAAAAIAVLAVRYPPKGARWLLWVLIGVIGGVACGLKLYGPLFIAPLGLYVALRDRSVLSLVVMTAAGITTALVPFLLPMFPLENYVKWFGIVAEKPTDGEMVTKAFRYGVFFLLPALALLIRRFMSLSRMSEALQDPETVYAGATVIGMLLCGYVASKPGAGMYYLLPFAALSIDMAVRFGASFPADRNGRAAAFAPALAAVLAAVMLVSAVPVQKRFFRALEWDRVQSIKDDLLAIMAQYPERKIQMAVGSSIGGYHNTLQKTELIYAGHPYNVDFGVMIETSFLGIPLSDPLVATIAACETDIWLVPEGEVPLSLNGYYGNTVVAGNFRDAFMTAYAKVGSTAHFDLWACRKN
ncbi:MAG: glycosyltransferase family 39 protein [Rhodospirillales bacterium]|nr:glycosyltransferase family 39 protein [Rhodospirillales bacterium]MBO6786850.1 glycosyltransferase family 39 protein [Rhodospirillales bacterium]